MSCGWPERMRLSRRAAEVVAGAFADALAEEGIGPHDGGACPAPGCACTDEAVAARVEARATELAAERLGLDLTPDEVNPGE